MRKELLVRSSEFIVLFIVLFLLPTTNSELITVHGQTTSCGTYATNPRAQGLVTTPVFPGVTSKFGTTGGCIIDPKAAFVPFKIPTYDDLKSLYYDQIKASKDSTTFPSGSSISSTTIFSGDKVYYDSGNLAISGSPKGTGTQVIFVNGTLDINSNYTYGSASTGTLFIVNGNINISSSVTTINAILIAGGYIYTGGAGCSLATNPGTNSVLTINGSLISLTPASPIKFCRRLPDPQNSTTAAEKINHQVKYLVLLRNVYSDTISKWSEISANATPAPTAIPAPTSTSTPAPPPVPIAESFECGSFTCNTGNFPWSNSVSDISVNSTDTKPTGGGTYVAKLAGNSTPNSTRSISFTHSTAAGNITFYRRVSSELSDFLRFYIDNTLKDEWSGNYAFQDGGDWQRASYPVTAGTHTFKWTYIKDNDIDTASDAAWVDLITYPL